MIIRCSECGNEISDKARACPVCGALIGIGGQAVSRSKSTKSLALFLAMCFGCVGAHNFYLGNKIEGIIKIVLSFFGMLIFTVIHPIFGVVMLSALEIWAIIEGLGCQTDSDGNILEW